MTERPDLITVGELRQRLSIYADDVKLDFSGLDFYRIKPWGEHMAIVEFNQPVHRGSDGRVVVQNPE